MDEEELAHHDTYLGKSGELFKTAKGICVNAETYGALNIIRKVFCFDVFIQKLSHYIKKPIDQLHNYSNKPSAIIRLKTELEAH